ncbi:hypothetical protein Tco_0718766 [Tanacetum coccineum]
MKVPTKAGCLSQCDINSDIPYIKASQESTSICNCKDIVSSKESTSVSNCKNTVSNCSNSTSDKNLRFHEFDQFPANTNIVPFAKYMSQSHTAKSRNLNDTHVVEQHSVVPMKQMLKRTHV